MNHAITTAQFTPGPWSWDDEGGWMDHQTGMRVWCLIQGPEGDEGGSIFEGAFVLEDVEKNLANARLIATAPELYEALAEAKLLLRVDEEPSRSAWRKASAALAKVSGQ